MTVVGLTGGIGSGKTTVADLFAALGVAIVDTDVIARELTGVGGAAMPAITAEFGRNILLQNGALDRNAMRRLVFADDSAKGRLSHSSSPDPARKRIALRDGVTHAPYVLLVVPLLLEAKVYRERVQRVLVVDCDEETQISRVMTRSGLSRDEVRAIMATQASRDQRLATMWLRTGVIVRR